MIHWYIILDEHYASLAYSINLYNVFGILKKSLILCFLFAKPNNKNVLFSFSCIKNGCNQATFNQVVCFYHQVAVLTP